MDLGPTPGASYIISQDPTPFCLSREESSQHWTASGGLYRHLSTVISRNPSQGVREFGTRSERETIWQSSKPCGIQERPDTFERRLPGMWIFNVHAHGNFHRGSPRSGRLSGLCPTQRCTFAKALQGIPDRNRASKAIPTVSLVIPPDDVYISLPVRLRTVANNSTSPHKARNGLVARARQELRRPHR